MPLLFAIHNSLEEVKAQLEGEFAFFGDVYIVARPARIRFLYNLIGSKLLIQLHKERPERGIGEDCALTGCSSSDQMFGACGIKILGTPVGSLEFVARLAQERLDEEEKLWNANPWVPDLQCGKNPRPTRGDLVATSGLSESVCRI